MNSNFRITAAGRYNAEFFVSSIADVRFWVDGLKARNDVSVIRVFLPSGAVRTIAYEGNGWVGAV
jgi:hypothetical protein